MCIFQSFCSMMRPHISAGEDRHIVFVAKQRMRRNIWLAEWYRAPAFSDASQRLTEGEPSCTYIMIRASASKTYR